MAALVTITTFAGLAPPWSLPQLDTDIGNLQTAIQSQNTFSNFAVDTGVANAYVTTPVAGIAATLTAGLLLQFKAINANTGASTLNHNALGVKNILNPNGTALASGQIPAASVVTVIYDGTQFQIQSISSFSSAAVITNSLSGDVALNNVANYFDGPSVAQGTVGTWFASGTVTLSAGAAGGSAFHAKLWDGTTLIATASTSIGSVSNNTISLSGFITSPAGNIRISAREVSFTDGKILFNFTGNSKDSTVTAFRIA